MTELERINSLPLSQMAKDCLGPADPTRLYLAQLVTQILNRVTTGEVQTDILTEAELDYLYNLIAARETWPRLYKQMTKPIECAELINPIEDLFQTLKQLKKINDLEKSQETEQLFLEMIAQNLDSNDQMP